MGPELGMWEDRQDQNWGCGRTYSTRTGDEGEPIVPELGMKENL